MEWKEDAASRMRVVVTASKDLKELLRIRWRRFFLGQETGGLGRVEEDYITKNSTKATKK